MDGSLFLIFVFFKAELFSVMLYCCMITLVIHDTMLDDNK